MQHSDSHCQLIQPISHLWLFCTYEFICSWMKYYWNSICYFLIFSTSPASLSIRSSGSICYPFTSSYSPLSSTYWSSYSSLLLASAVLSDCYRSINVSNLTLSISIALNPPSASIACKRWLSPRDSYRIIVLNKFKSARRYTMRTWACWFDFFRGF